VKLDDYIVKADEVIAAVKSVYGSNVPFVLRGDRNDKEYMLGYVEGMEKLRHELFFSHRG